MPHTSSSRLTLRIFPFSPFLVLDAFSPRWGFSSLYPRATLSVEAGKISSVGGSGGFVLVQAGEGFWMNGGGIEVLSGRGAIHGGSLLLHSGVNLCLTSSIVFILHMPRFACFDYFRFLFRVPCFSLVFCFQISSKQFLLLPL